MTDVDPSLLQAYPGGMWGLLATSLLLSGLAVALSAAVLWRWRLADGAHQPFFENTGPVAETARQLLREFEKNSGAVDDPLVSWTPDTLRRILRTELPGAQVIVVSNREPYIHNLKDGEVDLIVPASGLVSALEPVTRACAGTWIAHGGGSADKITVDEHDHVQVPPGKPAYTLRRVWLSEEEQHGHYSGFSNDGLWPLCHIAFTRPLFRASDWETYEAVNQKFADIVVEEARNERPIVLIQDYHFALLPRMIRRRLPEAIIITFWHIPWPNSEVFSICPWREQILDGLLGSSIMGFHIQFHCNNFMESVDRFLESRIEREHSSISYGGQTTLVHSYPISIEWPPAALETQPPVEECRRKIFERYGLSDDTKLFVGVERMDYTKGIVDRFQAIEELFTNHPEWIGRLVFLQIAAPSRGTLPAYQHLHQECVGFVDAFNQRYGTDGYKPIIMLAEHHTQEDIYNVYRAADACVVSSLHDGMNLVAKEFVASRDDEQGVLILSTFAGAARELLEAVIVNPYDATAMGEAMMRALTMSAEEQRQRMRRMREIVRDNNIYRWAGSMLQDAARLRKRNSIQKVTENPQQQNLGDNIVRMFDKRKSLIRDKTTA
ncbi:trehalose-6-phosphate synthase [Mesorhizobium sp. WSM2239]|uniref:Trehalose-6-phosphate synthase n=2 Tax=unclassified Mesorhizobium TaxID=325217 RepID=A0AAU8D945_9HYPH